MKNKVLICLDVIKYPNRGVGRVSIEFSKEITNTNAFDYTYLLPPNVLVEHLNNQQVITLNNYRKLSSNYMKKFDVCHVLHQIPKFSFQKAKRTVLTIHDLNFLYTKNKLKQKKYKGIVQSAIYRSDAICFISEYTKNDCFNYLDIPKDKITRVIYNGVNDLILESSKPAWCPQGNYLFSIGQFLTKKNFHILLPFIKLLPNDYSLIIAGENSTSYGSELRNLIVHHNLQSRIILPGTITESQKSYLYKNCTAFVFPSIAEGFGLPIIEAMKCGKAVFCSNKTSLEEIGNKYAYFWDNFDPEYMVDVFYKGIKDYNENPLKIPFQILYANSFNWKKNIESYIEIYKALV